MPGCLFAEQTKPSIRDPALCHRSQNRENKEHTGERDSAVQAGSLAIKIRGEHRNSPHLSPKASREGAMPREASKALEHLHRKDQPVKPSNSPAGVWGTYDLPQE